MIELPSAQALSDYCAEAKTKQGREALAARFSDRAPLYGALFSDEPKRRKNAARLLGALGEARDAETLAEALFKEDTRFAVPSILLALGSCGGDAALHALTAYEPPAPLDAAEEKHCREIAEARQKALSALRGRARAAGEGPVGPAYALNGRQKLLLTHPAGFSDVLCAELAAKGLSGTALADGVTVETDDLQKVFAARSFYELLLPLGYGLPLAPEAIADAAKGALPGPYRVELRGFEGDRAALIRRVAVAAGGENSPSDYDFELRVLCRGQRCSVFIKPMGVPDARFSYRLGALPASMHPAMAAALVRTAQKYAPARPAVLDPCCGSGTLLIECEKAFPCRALVGVDIAGNALDAARKNAAAAQSRAAFVRRDMLAFEPRSPFDLVLANLPFGNRVGTHGSNERLYAAFAQKLPSLLSEKGVALLYTMEYKLLRESLARVPALAPLTERRTEAGGLLPGVFLVRKKQEADPKA